MADGLTERAAVGKDCHDLWKGTVCLSKTSPPFLEVLRSLREGKAPFYLGQGPSVRMTVCGGALGLAHRRVVEDLEAARHLKGKAGLCCSRTVPSFSEG